MQADYVKTIVLVGFSDMQLALARKYVAYRRLQNDLHLLPEVQTTLSVDAYVVNTDHAGAARRLADQNRLNIAPALGLGETPLSGINAQMPGPFKPATIDRLMQLLHSCPSVSTLKRIEDTLSIEPLPVQTALAAAAVLVVDDSELVRKTMVRKIAAYGQRVDTAHDGNEALAMLMGSSYTLVFVDVMMPGIDGFELCKRIKKSTEHKATAVYMLSSKDGMFDKVRGVMAGCNGYLVKPLESVKLLAVLRNHFPNDSAVAPDSELAGDSGFFNDSRLPGHHLTAAATSRPARRPLPAPKLAPAAPFRLGNLPMEERQLDSYATTVLAAL